MIPIVFTIECRVVIDIRRHIRISFEDVFLWWLIVDLHQITYQLNIGVRDSGSKELGVQNNP